MQYISSTFGTFHIPLSEDELLIMRYGHIVITTNCTYNYINNTQVSCCTDRALIPADEFFSEVDILVDDHTWRLKQRLACTCISPEYWFTPTSCRNHSLRDSIYYYKQGEIIALGYKPHPILDVRIDYEDDAQSIDSGISMRIKSKFVHTINVLEKGVTSNEEYEWFAEEFGPTNWKHWQRERSRRCMSAMGTTYKDWYLDPAPYLSFEVGLYSLFIPPGKVFPQCLESGNMRQRELRIFNNIEQFVSAGGIRVAILPLQYPEVELGKCFYIRTDADLIFTINQFPIVRIGKSNFGYNSVHYRF